MKKYFMRKTNYFSLRGKKIDYWKLHKADKNFHSFFQLNE